MVFGQRSRPIRNCPDFSPAVNCPALRGWADCEFQMLNLVADSGLKCDGKPDLLFSAACNHNQMWPVVQESERSQPYCGCIECIFHAPLLVAYLKLSSSHSSLYAYWLHWLHVLNDIMILMKWLYFVVILWLFPQKINAQNAEFSPQFTAPWPLVLLVPRAEQLVSAFSGVRTWLVPQKEWDIEEIWRDMKRSDMIKMIKCSLWSIFLQVGTLGCQIMARSVLCRSTPTQTSGTKFLFLRLHLPEMLRSELFPVLPGELRTCN